MLTDNSSDQDSSGINVLSDVICASAKHMKICRLPFEQQNVENECAKSQLFNIVLLEYAVYKLHLFVKNPMTTLPVC